MIWLAATTKKLMKQDGILNNWLFNGKSRKGMKYKPGEDFSHVWLPFKLSTEKTKIIANEWYKEYHLNGKTNALRDMEEDAAEAQAKDEKIFE